MTNRLAKVWLLVARQWGLLPVNFRKPVAVDTNADKDYVGQYQWRPLDEVETVSLKDGKLWSNLGGDEDQAFPLGSETMIAQVDFRIAVIWEATEERAYRRLKM